MLRKLLLVLSICTYLLNTNIQAQTNDPIYTARKEAFVDSCLVNFNDDAIIFQAYRGLPVDTSELNPMLRDLPTNEKSDFQIVKLVRLLFLSNGTYDTKILNALNSIPFWLTKGDTVRGYWSENHMIQWISSDWLLHESYGKVSDPDLRNRVEHYLDLKIDHGFYEFYSPTYNPYSLAGLLNLADFSQDTVIKNKAILASQRLLKDFLLMTNDLGVYFPVAGRSYTGKYENAYGQNHSRLIYLLTGRGEFPNSASHASVFLGTSDIFVDDVVATQNYDLDTLYSIGHSLDSGFVLNAGQAPLDKTLFQWSSGAYFMPEVTLETATLIEDSSLWAHTDFTAFNLLENIPLNDLTSLAEFLGATSKSSLISGEDIYLFKHNSLVLSSVPNFFPGKAGYQQFTCMANVGETAVYILSGKVKADWQDRSPNNANEHLPYVEQKHNAALLMYWPEDGNFLLKDRSVALHFTEADMDEIVEDSLWLIGRHSDNYVAVRRSCMDMQKGLPACVNDSVQSWAIVVGDSLMYGSFSNFQSLVSNATFTESFTYNASASQTEYFASLSFDTISIEHTWTRDSIISSIEDIAIDETSATIYPNPAQNSFNISLDAQIQNAHIEVMDLTGRSIYSTSAGNTSLVKVEMGNWPNGMYLVRIQHSNGSITKKLLKN